MFAWRNNMLLIKSSGATTAGWQLSGFIQYDSWGRPAFMHRTINKWSLSGEAWPIELISAPMPRR